jgi:hypothetical protein
VGITHGKHADFYALFSHFFSRMNLEPERITPNGQTLFDALCGYPDMINF